MITLNQTNKRFLLKRCFEPELGNTSIRGWDGKDIYDQVKSDIGSIDAFHEAEWNFYSPKEWEMTVTGTWSINERERWVTFHVVWHVDEPIIDTVYIHDREGDHVGDVDV